MLTALALLPLAHTIAIAPVPQQPELLASVPAIEGQALPRIPNEVMRYQEVRPLPGQLDSTPVFNSNSPEMIQQPGILLSTFPPNNMAREEAHLDFAFDGRFDFFAHHVARGVTSNDRRTLFIGGVIYNPNSEPVTLQILQGVSYLSQEAPFRNLPELVSNPEGKVFAGPGSRVVTDFLQGRNQSQWPAEVTIPPRQAYLLMNAPIPLRRLPFAADATLPPGSVLPANPSSFASSAIASVNINGDNVQLPSNGRSVLLHLSSDAPVYAATLAMYAPLTLEGQERAPTLQEWLLLLVNGGLAGPRDIPPSNPEEYQKSDNSGRFYYGRVAGVAQGSQWEAIAADESSDTLTLPAPGQSISYVVSTVDYNTFGTEQIQSAPMLARYSDTSYRAHGNYGVHYKITLPLNNPTDVTQRVDIKLQTPLQDETLKSGLRFLRNPQNRIFFRGTVRVWFESEFGVEQSRYVHVVQRQGQEGESILRLNLPPNTQRNVVVEFIYPPDATPPQVLTVSTLGAYDTFSADAEEEPTVPAMPEAEIPSEDPLEAVVEEEPALPEAPQTEATTEELPPVEPAASPAAPTETTLEEDGFDDAATVDPEPAAVPVRMGETVGLEE